MILAATGQDAVAKRDLITRVPDPKMSDNDNRSVDGSTLEYSAPFNLEVEKVDINRLDNKVRLDIKLTDPRINANPERVNELSDKTSDVIDTVFWAAHGDVAVLDSLPRNGENTTTSSISGTIGAQAPLTPLIGDTDKLSTNLSETILFMAPTVIDPSPENQPHSAFRTRSRSKMQEASKADSIADTDNQYSTEPKWRVKSRGISQFLLGLAVEVSCFSDIDIFRDHTIEI